MATTTDSRVGAVVLAAGRSERMGEPKQLLRVGDKTVLQRTLENVIGACVAEVVLVLGFSAEAIRRALPVALLDGLNVVVNEHYELGMASSLQKGLCAMSSQMDAALIVMADQPLVRSETMGRIIERYRMSDAKIVIPYYKGKRGNPVLLGRAVFAEGMRLEGDAGFRVFFDRYTDAIGPVDVDDEGILLDIDNRDDYERVLGS